MFDARPVPERAKRGASRLSHAALSFAALAGAAASVALAIEIFGSPRDAAPRETILLFAPPPAERVALRDRLADTPLIMDGDARLPVADLGAETAAHGQHGVQIQVDPSLDQALAMADPRASEPQEASEPATRRYAPSPLIRAPIPAITRQGPNGPLPIVSQDGRRALTAYARPFTANGKPRIALVVASLGLDAEATRAAIEDLPPEVTLSFIPYTPDLQSWIDRARAQGHEVIIELPMESFDARADTGPQALLSTASAEENNRRLDYLLSRAQGYFAVANYQGARLAAQDDALRQVLSALDRKGLGLLHDGTTARPAFQVGARAVGLPFTSIDRMIDRERKAEAIDAQLLQLEALALQNGTALGGAIGYADTVEQVAAWAETLALKGYQLAPASAVLRERAEVR